MDHSDRIGALKPYRLPKFPDWIYIPEYGKYIAYVQQPSGNAWITELEENNPPAHISTTEPLLLRIDLPNDIHLVAKLSVFNRGQQILFLPRHSDKLHAFVTTPNGIAYSGHLKLRSF